MKKEAPEKGRAGFVKPSQRVAERQARPRAAAGRRLGDFYPLSSGERKLLDACRSGEIAVVSEQRPEATNDSVRVRAGFVRFLLLGGDAQASVHENGVRLQGAWIEGDLDLDGCEVPITVAIFRSHFEGLIRAQEARLSGVLVLSGSYLALGIRADGLRVEGDVVLRDGFRAMASVRLLGAQIGGDLSCTKGHFVAKDGFALSIDRASVKGSVFLRDGFRAEGQVTLVGTQIGGNLNCSRGQFDAGDGIALLLEGAVVKGALLLRGLKSPARINAGHLSVEVLVDELGCWASGSVLDGFRYGALGGDAPTQGAARLAWLRRQPSSHLGESEGGARFRPQPWRHLQKVMRDLGHAENARQIGMSYERHLRRAGRVGQSPAGTARWRALPKQVLAMFLHRLFGLLAGYGYRPMRLLAWMLSVWLSFGVFFWALALPPRSALAPSNPLVFQNAAYEECLPDREPTPGNWFLCAPLRGEYATLSPLVFSLDIILPLVDLGQEKHWGAFVATPKPVPNEELWAHWSWGHLARLLIWFETLFGWVCSLLLVAIVSGFARRSDEG